MFNCKAGIVSGSPLLGFGPLPARQVNIIDFHGLQDESIPYSVDWGYGRGPAGAVETIISSDGLYYYDKAQYLQYLAEGWGCQVSEYLLLLSVVVSDTAAARWRLGTTPQWTGWRAGPAPPATAAGAAASCPAPASTATATPSPGTSCRAAASSGSSWRASSQSEDRVTQFKLYNRKISLSFGSMTDNYLGFLILPGRLLQPRPQICRSNGL